MKKSIIPDAGHGALIEACCRYIERTDHLPSLQELADHVGLSSYYLHRLFKAQTGVTPREYANAQRADRVRRALISEPAITDAIYIAGFNSQGRFYEQSTQMLGMTPSHYKAGGVSMTIHFAIGQCTLGAILVASTDKGVCAILLGDDPQALLDDLQQRFPKAQLLGADESFDAVVATVVGLVEQPATAHHLPLDVQGTVFQLRVWKALQSIPAGHTATYKEIAHLLGQPAAVRAVASACGANPVAVAIPCHRVVRMDGNLAGYRWGLERKRELLSREIQHKPT